MGAITLISYDPFFATLDEKNAKLYDLINAGVLTKPTAAKFRKNQSVSLSTIHDICKYLDCPIEKIVRID